MSKENEDKYKLFEIGRCEFCGGQLRDMGFEVYMCSKCGKETLSEFGLVKQYVDENGPSNALEISEGTGVPVKKIEKWLREGRIEIPEGSEIYIPCEKCGRDIRYGRYCPECAAIMTKQFKSVISIGEVGEVPKNTGKMRFNHERR